MSSAFEPQTVNGPPRAVHARLLNDLVHAMSAGYLLPPTAVAVLVGRDGAEIVQQALGEGPRREAEIDERVQLHLRNVVSVMSAAERHFGDVERAVQWYRGRHGAGAQNTPESLVAAGRLEDAYRLLVRG